MKGFIINAHTNGKTTEVTKQTKYGTFKGQVVLHPEDADVKSQLDGYVFAEEKCDIKAMKMKARLFKERAKGVRHAYNVLRQSCDPKDEVMIKLERQVKQAWKLYEYYYETYLFIKDNYKPNIERLLAFRRQIRQKKND